MIEIILVLIFLVCLTLFLSFVVKFQQYRIEDAEKEITELKEIVRKIKKSSYKK